MSCSKLIFNRVLDIGDRSNSTLKVAPNLYNPQRFLIYCIFCTILIYISSLRFFFFIPDRPENLILTINLLLAL